MYIQASEHQLNVPRFKRSSTPYYLRPLLYHHPATDTTPERVSLQFSRRSFTGYAAYKRSDYMPPLSDAQAEALDALHFTAMKHQLTMQLEKGDIQFINNVALVHAREGFRDEPENRYVQSVCLFFPPQIHFGFMF